MRSLALAILIFTVPALALTLDTSIARAQSAADLERPKNPKAKEHFTTGNRLYRVREFEKAIAEYKAGVLAEDLPIFGYNLAQCYRQLGKYEEAIWHYERFLGRVDPGPEMRASIDGFLLQMKNELATRAKQPPPAEPAPNPAPVAPAPVVAAPPLPVPPPPRDPPRRSRTLPIVLVGAGAAALIAGGVLYAIDEDPDRLDPMQREVTNTAPLAVGLGIAGLVAAGTGGVLWWRSSTSHPTVAAHGSGVLIGWSAQF